MKKLHIYFLSISIISLFACGGNAEQERNNNENDSEEMNMEEAHGHDHGDHDPSVHKVMDPDTEFSEAPAEAKVFFANLSDGDVVTSPLTVEMGVEGMTIHAAGEVIEGTGHHHIIIDEGPVPMSEIVPADERHIHFGGGQTETVIELEPGSHTLTLQLADGMHRSYGEPMSSTIEINVQAQE